MTDRKVPLPGAAGYVASQLPLSDNICGWAKAACEHIAFLTAPGAPARPGRVS